MSMLRIGQVTCWMSLFGLLAIQSVYAEETLPVRVSGAWKLVESTNFRCWSQLPDDEARELAQCCEVWRDRIRTTWIAEPNTANWTPKCDVYVHPTIAAYNQALRRPGDSSVGSTIMNFDQGRTVQRRIDVRADASDWSNAALPHELTHVVLGERFGGRSLPRWADEGIAMLSESAEKHRERRENLQEILAGRPTMSMLELVSTSRLPAPHLRDAYYGQSLALSSLLVRKKTPAKFADFVEESLVSGMDRALRQHYAINGMAALQLEWNEWVRNPEAVTFVSLPIQIGKAASITSVMDP
jgi:hypothetical protein